MGETECRQAGAAGNPDQVAGTGAVAAQGAIRCDFTERSDADVHRSACGVAADNIDAVFAGMDAPPATGALSGPSFALEVARGLPVALTLASTDAALRQSAVAALHHGAMRIYATPDVVGVEVGGAVKNVLAIATGVSDGMGLGNNARAALITRGMTEIRRLGKRMGANPRTFTGLAGYGDLILTCTGNLSRNHSLGQKIAAGERLGDILATMRMVAEGVRTAKSVYNLSRKLGVEMPICQHTYRILYEELPPREALFQLMTRDLKSELDDD